MTCGDDVSSGTDIAEIYAAIDSAACTLAACSNPASARMTSMPQVLPAGLLRVPVVASIGSEEVERYCPVLGNLPVLGTLLLAGLPVLAALPWDESVSRARGQCAAGVPVGRSEHEPENWFFEVPCRYLGG